MNTITTTITTMCIPMTMNTPIPTALALLTYMLGHNRHHAEELHELAHDVDGEAQQLLHDAVVDFTLGNEKLEEALRILKGE